MRYWVWRRVICRNHITGLDFKDNSVTVVGWSRGEEEHGREVNIMSWALISQGGCIVHNALQEPSSILFIINKVWNMGKLRTTTIMLSLCLTLLLMLTLCWD